MPSYQAEVRIEAPQAQVFDRIADLERHPEWSADPLEVRLVSGDGGTGSRYESTATSKGKTITAEIEVNELDAPRRLVFTVTDLTGTYRHEFDLRSRALTTIVRRRITALALSLPQRLLFYVVLPIVKKPNARRALQKLKAACEHQGAGALDKGT